MNLSYLVSQFLTPSCPGCSIIQIAKHTITLTTEYAVDSLLSVAKETEFFHDMFESGGSFMKKKKNKKTTFRQPSGLSLKSLGGNNGLVPLGMTQQSPSTEQSPILLGWSEDMLRVQGLVWANGNENYLSNKEKHAIVYSCFGFPRDQEGLWR